MVALFGWARGTVVVFPQKGKKSYPPIQMTLFFESSRIFYLMKEET